MLRWAAILSLLAGAAQAACPPPPDREEERRALMAELRAAQTEDGARETSRALWEIWTDAPDARAQAMLDLGVASMARRDLAAARAAFDDLVDYCPDYAEGWNQRAFAAFLAQDFAGALPDLDRALELSPEHLGALSGRALTLMGLGRTEDAQAQLREALRLNPWLAERALLDGPPEREL